MSPDAVFKAQNALKYACGRQKHRSGAYSAHQNPRPDKIRPTFKRTKEEKREVHQTNINQVSGLCGSLSEVLH